jgi:hypothetical protein
MPVESSQAGHWQNTSARIRERAGSIPLRPPGSAFYRPLHLLWRHQGQPTTAAGLPLRVEPASLYSYLDFRMDGGSSSCLVAPRPLRAHRVRSLPSFRRLSFRLAAPRASHERVSSCPPFSATARPLLLLCSHARASAARTSAPRYSSSSATGPALALALPCRRPLRAVHPSHAGVRAPVAALAPAHRRQSPRPNRSHSCSRLRLLLFQCAPRATPPSTCAACREPQLGAARSRCLLARLAARAPSRTPPAPARLGLACLEPRRPAHAPARSRPRARSHRT